MLRGRKISKSLAIFTLGAALAFSCVLPAGIASAQLVAAETGEDAKYRAVLRDALAEYDAGHFEEARILFRRAHDLNPNARTLRSIGMASFELRDYVVAVRSLTAALAETRKSLNAEQRAHVQGLLERSLMFVDIYTLSISPPDARVLVDGHAPELEPNGTMLLSFGTHNVEVSKTGYLPRTVVVGVRGGERKELSVTLDRKPAPRPAAEARAPLVNPPVKSERLVQRWQPRVPWLIAAGGAALLAAGAGGLWLFQNNELNDCNHEPAGVRCSNESAVRSKRNLAAGATLTAGAGAVTMALIGLLNWEMMPATAQRAVKAASTCSILPNTLVCGTTF